MMFNHMRQARATHGADVIGARYTHFAHSVIKGELMLTNKTYKLKEAYYFGKHDGAVEKFNEMQSPI